jgi:outer membrane protein OmpA-like peptidoglycan-associated protein
MKRLLLSQLISIALCSIAIAQSGVYSVQLAAFETPVDIPNYFAGIDNVTYVKDGNDIHRYIIMGIYDGNEAKAKAEQMKKVGYKASVIDHSKLFEKCQIECDKAAPTPISVVEDEENERLKWLFFDYNKDNLKETSLYQLENLQNILRVNPTYTAELSAHTDSKGTEQYNWWLSKRRATNVVSFLNKKGILTDRVKVDVKGETAPFAKNELAGGFDCEEGRQLNRRVEIKVYDGSGKPLSLVDLPQIPEALR